MSTISEHDVDPATGGSAFQISASAESLASHILSPGSTLNPQFLLVLDGAFGMLLGIFLVLLVLTWSIHFIALICIELGLWASVKLYVCDDDALDRFFADNIGLVNCAGTFQNYVRTTRKRQNCSKMVILDPRMSKGSLTESREYP
jgi:ER protein Pkr1